MAYQFRNASVLIVDDMEPMLALVASLLDIFGFSRIYKATNAEEGLQLFLDHNPDIVLVDWQMEPFNGIELVRRMRADPKSPNRFVPIIMMTGFSHRIRVEEARDVGVTEFLVKPFKAKDLYTRIEQIAERPRRFVEAETFFGPDRRRKLVSDDYGGPKRRELDEERAVRHEEVVRLLCRGERDQVRGGHLLPLPVVPAREGRTHLPPRTKTNRAMKARLMKNIASTRPTVRKKIVCRRPWASG